MKRIRTTDDVAMGATVPFDEMPYTSDKDVLVIPLMDTAPRPVGVIEFERDINGEAHVKSYITLGRFKRTAEGWQRIA